MGWAITPRQVGETVGARRIRNAADVGAGEFYADDWQEGYRLVGGNQLRPETPAERDERTRPPTPPESVRNLGGAYLNAFLRVYATREGLEYEDLVDMVAAELNQGQGQGGGQVR